jgi:hypothetical protein
VYQFLISSLANRSSSMVHTSKVTILRKITITLERIIPEVRSNRQHIWESHDFLLHVNLAVVPPSLEVVAVAHNENLDYVCFQRRKGKAVAETVHQYLSLEVEISSLFEKQGTYSSVMVKDVVVGYSMCPHGSWGSHMAALYSAVKTVEGMFTVRGEIS